MTDRPNTASPHMVYHADEYGFSLSWTGRIEEPVERHDGGYNEPVGATYAGHEVIRRAKSDHPVKWMEALMLLALDIGEGRMNND